MAARLPSKGDAVDSESSRTTHDENCFEDIALIEEEDLGETFEAARQRVLQSPDASDRWDRLEQLGQLADRASDVAEAYRHALHQNLDPALFQRLAERALRFHDEWHGDPYDVCALLMRVLEIDATARWAFDRVSLQLTLAARWDDLLKLYDEAIEGTHEPNERMDLLDEAAAVAKDCAGRPDRAVHYLSQHFKLRPLDQETFAALERLLKAQKRYRELIDFWTARLEVLGDHEAVTTRQQIASCWLEDLNDPCAALEAVEPLLSNPVSSEGAYTLLEMILRSPASSRDVRRKARDLLSERYDSTDRWQDLVGGLRVALAYVDADEQLELHEQITRRLVTHGRHDDALEHLAALVVLAPQQWPPERLDAVLRGEFADKVASCRPIIDREQGRKLLHLAADMASRRFRNRERAMDLYEQLLVDIPDDIETIGQLSRLYADAGRTHDLLELRKHELDLAETMDRRLALRLDIAGLLGAVDDHAAALDTLKANLVERADHEPTISSLLRALEAQKRFAELADLLTEQATELEALKRERLAASLWFKVAHLAENELEDLDRAVACYRRVVDLNPDTDAIDALANIHLSRHEHTVAVGWLEQRLALTAPGERTDTLRRLAHAHCGAGQTEQALSTLRAGLQEDSSSRELLRLLCDLHRRAGEWNQLVSVLEQGVEHTTCPRVRFELLMEAADVYQHELGSPGRAASVLEQAAALAPFEQGVRVALAEALRTAGRLNDARTLAKTLIDEFGRRRPPERAKLHFLLAQVVYAQGDVTEAVRQLEQAASMDDGHVDVLRMLGKVYRATGQLQRAERIYHVLLLLARRKRATGTQGRNDGVGVAEALFELHRVTKDLGATDRAAESLESAFDSANQSLDEAMRLEHAIRDAASPQLLLRALKQRLAMSEDPDARSAILIEMAGTLELHLGRPGDALDALLGALRTTPAQGHLYDRAMQLAKRNETLDAYVKALTELEQAALDAGNAALGCDLLLRLGSIAEQQDGQLDRAAELYAQAEETGERLAEVWSALARVAGARGDRTTEMDSLRKLADSDLEALPRAGGTEALYRLAELELSVPDAIRSGIDTLSRALAREPQVDRATQAIRRALELDPSNETLAARYEHLARKGQDAALLLDAIVRRIGLPNVTQDLLREGAEVAASIDDQDGLVAILQRAVDVARNETGDRTQALWAMRTLASLRQRQGDHRDAVRWMCEAAGVASGDDARQLTLEAARIAAESIGDMELAATTYETLLQRDPGDPAIWKPLLHVLRQLGDADRLERLLNATALAVSDPQERKDLRLEHARLLRDRPDRRDNAILLLRTVLADDPDHVEAATQLVDHLERAERVDELAELLRRQLDAARNRHDTSAGAQFALRVSALMTKRKDDARAVLRSTLEWVPNDPLLLRALLALLDPEDHAAEHADLLDRLLANTTLDEKLDLAVDLAHSRARIGDLSGMARALDLACRFGPSDARVLVLLRQLAALLETEGLSLPHGHQAAERLARAAQIHADRLEDPQTAADLAAKAVAAHPTDLDLLDLLVRYMVNAGQSVAAAARVTAALDEPLSEGEHRAKLLHARARAWSAHGEYDAAVRDLEDAMLIEGNAAA
ncbi:MAG: tetratricopeptide repeat protein, partial [Polyangiaceae bacterium]|nr:tetratricopeptide repeat protein [Polyangiaceae bacterium]